MTHRSFLQRHFWCISVTTPPDLFVMDQYMNTEISEKPTVEFTKWVKTCIACVNKEVCADQLNVSSEGCRPMTVTLQSERGQLHHAPHSPHSLPLSAKRIELRGGGGGDVTSLWTTQQRKFTSTHETFGPFLSFRWGGTFVSPVYELLYLLLVFFFFCHLHAACKHRLTAVTLYGAPSDPEGKCRWYRFLRGHGFFRFLENEYRLFSFLS